MPRSVNQRIDLLSGSMTSQHFRRREQGDLDRVGALAELALADHRVPEINANVELQRRVIKQLAEAGKDTTSAEIMLDSLLVSLFLAAEHRHRLRALLQTGVGETSKT